MHAVKNSKWFYEMLPWIPEPSTVNNKLKRREGSGKNRPVEPEPSRRFNLLFTVEGSGIQGNEMFAFVKSDWKARVWRHKRGHTDTGYL